jgi:dTDP-4-dehydrorhamnose 3,5-epimerase-like enzyme
MDSTCKVLNGAVAVDDRGSVRFVNDFNFEGVKRFYQVENHRQGFIRAWHGHKKEGKYVWVASGSALVGAVSLDCGEIPDNLKNNIPQKYILSSSSPKILWIPPGYANGFKSLEDNTKIIFFSTATMDEAKTDDIRYPYDLWNIWSEDFR